jgi:hypothetical protein
VRDVERVPWRSTDSHVRLHEARALADSAWWNAPADEPVDALLRDALHALRDRVTQFRAVTPRPLPRMVDDFCLALSDEFDAALRAANGRAVERWAASLHGPRPKGQRGRPPSRRPCLVRTKKYRPFVDDSDTPIVMEAIARAEQAALDGRREPARAALVDAFCQYLQRDAARWRAFEARCEHHYHPPHSKRPGAEQRAQQRAQRAAVRSMVDRKRFARIERRLRRALSSRR